MQISNKTPPEPTVQVKDMALGGVFRSVEYPGEFFIRIPSASVDSIAKPVTAVQLRTGHLFRLEIDMAVIPVPTAILRFDGDTE